MKVILASASPRRRELLKWIVPDFTIDPASMEEILPEALPVTEQAAFLAEKKAENVAARHPEALVIGSDTVVICGDHVMGKPGDRQEAAAMLRELSGREHQVITGCAMIYAGKKKVFSQITRVTFYPLSQQEIQEYVATGECDDKAGAYGIQGRGALLVREITGDYYTVVGLPVARLKREIERMIADA